MMLQKYLRAPARFLAPLGLAMLLLLTPKAMAEDNDEPEIAEAGVSFNTSVPQAALFKPGQGYKFFRIPSLITTSKGSLLAFCEGRAFSYDSGRIDIVVRKSVDGGQTWSKLQRVAGDNTNTWGNPCSVVDRSNGRIWLFMCQNLGSDTNKTIDAGTSRGTRTIWACYSDDDGDTWSAPKNLTGTTKSPEWRWCATGPGIGIQLQNGRLLIPANFTDPVLRVSGNYMIYSDDHGATWTRGQGVFPQMNECQVAELENGKLLLNARPSGVIIGPDGKKNQFRSRVFAWSSDEGRTWSPPAIQGNLKDPRCQGSTLALPSSHLLVFSNPQGNGRQNLVIQTSDDNGKSWEKRIKLCDGPAAYSCLSLINPQSIGCLYEAGFANHSPEAIVFARIPLSALQ